MVLDDASKHKYVTQIISESKAKHKVLETVYYQTYLAKFYVDRDKIDMYREVLKEIEEIVNSNKHYSNEATYIMRKQKTAAFILSNFWTEQAQFLKANENYSEGIKCLE